MERIERGRIVPVGVIVEKHNARQYQNESALAELEASIAQNGILVPLIVAGKVGAQNVELVAGARRLAVARKLKIETVPADVVIGATAEELAALGLADNMQRENLTAIEEAEAFAGMVQSGKPPADIARGIGKTAKYVERRLALTALIPELRDALLHGVMHIWQAEMLSVLSKDKQGKLWKQYEFQPGTKQPMDWRDLGRAALLHQINDAAVTCIGAWPTNWAPKEGVACKECPKLFKVVARQFPELFASDERSYPGERERPVCTYEGCVKARTEAWLQHNIAGGAVPIVGYAYGDRRPIEELRKQYPGAIPDDKAFRPEKGCKTQKTVCVQGYNIGEVAQRCFGGCDTKWHNCEEPESTPGTTGRLSAADVKRVALKSDFAGKLTTALQVGAYGALCKAKPAALLVPLRKLLTDSLCDADWYEDAEAALLGIKNDGKRFSNIDRFVKQLPAGKVLPMLATVYIVNFEGGPDKALTSYGIPFPEAKAIREKNAAELEEALAKLDASKKAAARKTAKQSNKASCAKYNPDKLLADDKGEQVRRCRVCGCTEENACIGEAGPCHWVEPDLCSECQKNAPDKAAATKKQPKAVQELAEVSKRAKAKK